MSNEKNAQDTNQSQKKKKLITSALLYANGSLHIGHLVEYIQTDIYVRFLKLIGEDVTYVCADDTHGAPISINAEKLGMAPEELISKFNKEHIEDFKTYMVEFDNYYTTHSNENKYYADKLFKKCQENGFIFKKVIEQLFCEDCNRFLPDRYVKGICPKCNAEDQYGDVCEKCGTTYKADELISPKCAICNALPIKKESEHYFFKLSEFTEKLKTWLDKTPLQKEIVNSVSQWINEGLNDWDITRDGPYFGFNIPSEKDLYYYVWWDAPIGYIASSENWCQKNGLGNAEDYFWKNKDTDIIHFIGKDIIYFHFLFWPAVLMASEFNPPTNLNVHGFLTVNGEKMSKSRGTFLTAKDFAKDYEPEYLRYYYANVLSRKMSDLDLSFDDFIARVNNELVANLGNFCYRSLSFLQRNFDGKFDLIDDGDNAKKIMEEITIKFDLVKNAYNNINLNEAVREIMAISALGNKYFQDMQPWKLIKEDKSKAEAVLGTCINVAKNLSILMKPIMPEFSKKLELQLGLNHDLYWDDLGFDLKEHKMGNAEILINKIEKVLKKIMPFNVNVGKIESVENHPEADKLYVIKVDLGLEKRQLVAGLKPYYKPEELIGKQICVVMNLEYANLRGVESQGMLLAADKDGVVKVLELKGKPGDKVYLEGYEENPTKINIKQFMKIKRKVKNGNVLVGGEILKTDSLVIETDMPDGSVVR